MLFKFKQFRRSGPGSTIVLDFVMVFLLGVNLAWLVFDWIYASVAVQQLLAEWVPRFEAFYGSVIHPNFILIDLIFVAVFLTDFFVGWIIATVKRTYHRWFFYPFIHWYDLLGCIPVSGFRFLRLLRIVSIVYRLHRSGVIDLTDTAVGRVVKKYYGILMEELADRVSIKILGDVQQEVRTGGPVFDKIISDVVVPNREALVEWMSHRVENVASQNYERYRTELRTYIQERVNHAVRHNEQFARLDSIPMFGRVIRNAMEDAISDMVFDVVNGIMQDLASSRNRVVIDETVDLLFTSLTMREEDTRLDALVTETLDQSIEIIKQQLRIQQWKIRELAEDEEDLRARIREQLRSMDT